MHQSIRLCQGGYMAPQEEFKLTRDSLSGPWSVKYYWQWMSGRRSEEWSDVSKHFDSKWIDRTVEELRIFELMTTDEIGLPSYCDGSGFSITYGKDGSTKEIYYQCHELHLNDHPDVWRADTFWRLLKSMLNGMQGSGIKESPY